MGQDLAGGGDGRAQPTTAGLAFEAATAALGSAAELPDQPVLVVAQTANHRARKLAGRLGFKRPAPSRSTARSRPSLWPRWTRFGPMTGERANQRGACLRGCRGLICALRPAVAQGDKREVAISSNNYRSLSMSSPPVQEHAAWPGTDRPILAWPPRPRQSARRETLDLPERAAAFPLTMIHGRTEGNRLEDTQQLKMPVTGSWRTSASPAHPSIERQLENMEAGPLHREMRGR